MSVEPVLQARSLVKRYGRVTALDHADFDLYPGEILAVIGDNGAGKSTLIKALCGAVIPDSGEIRLGGEVVHFTSPIAAREAGIETVYQTLALSPALSIADNMFLGREPRAPGVMGQWFRATDRARMAKFAREKLNELGLMTIQNIHQPVETLSGGQRQGVAVARAAAFAKRVVIMDEPTAALGVKESRRVLELDPRREEAWAADHPHLAQHAPRVRSRRPYSHPPPGPPFDGRGPEEGDDVGCGRDDDRRHGPAGRSRGGLTRLSPAMAAGRARATLVTKPRFA